MLDSRDPLAARTWRSASWSRPGSARLACLLRPRVLMSSTPSGSPYFEVDLAHVSSILGARSQIRSALGSLATAYVLRSCLFDRLICFQHTLLRPGVAASDHESTAFISVAPLACRSRFAPGSRAARGPVSGMSWAPLERLRAPHRRRLSVAARSMRAAASRSHRIESASGASVSTRAVRSGAACGARTAVTPSCLCRLAEH